MKAAAAIAAVVACAVPATAHAFCGFYVSPGDAPLVNDATQVVLMRKGTRTVLSMQNDYKGPPDAFAMVVPVPVVLHEGDVKTLPKDVFERVERMGAPRLVEYWEQDPCYSPPMYEHMAAPAGRPAMRRARAPMKNKDLGVTIEAKFVVGEYQILILSAKDSTGLDTWLRREHYHIPRGAEPLLRPYVEAGSKFFVAKVDPKKVRFVNGRAALSPLRFHYDSEQFTLPIRLGLANSSGTQDLIVNILAPHQRYEVANYDNVTIPTNLDVKDSVRDHFGAFYAALFDRTLDQHPGAVVTEYSWQATTCDPCPGPTLNYHDFALLGADVLDAPAGAQLAAPPPAPPQAGGMPRPGGMPRRPIRPIMRRYPSNFGYDFVLTRLHARYGRDLHDDLVFRAADPIVGGREFVVDPATGKLEQGARSSSTNNFQGRYAIRHAWTGPVACDNPRRGVWGGPPPGVQGQGGPQAALGLALAPRGGVKLAASFVRDVPEIGLVGGVLAPIPHAAPPPEAAPPGLRPVQPAERGCGCQSSNPGGLALLLGGLGICLCRPRRRGRRWRSR